jgi:hypothetical protein
LHHDRERDPNRCSWIPAGCVPSAATATKGTDGLGEGGGVNSLGTFLGNALTVIAPNHAVTSAGFLVMPEPQGGNKANNSSASRMIRELGKTCSTGKVAP